MIDEDYIESFLEAYIETALWSSTDDDGTPLDENYDADDLAVGTQKIMHEECADFILYAQSELADSGLSAHAAGHNFWLTRNGHGAGFWDLGLGEVGLALTRKAKTAGSADLYASRGKIYQA